MEDFFPPIISNSPVLRASMYTGIYDEAPSIFPVGMILLLVVLNFTRAQIHFLHNIHPTPPPHQHWFFKKMRKKKGREAGGGGAGGVIQRLENGTCAGSHGQGNIPKPHIFLDTWSRSATSLHFQQKTLGKMRNKMQWCKTGIICCGFLGPTKELRHRWNDHKKTPVTISFYSGQEALWGHSLRLSPLKPNFPSPHSVQFGAERVKATPTPPHPVLPSMLHNCSYFLKRPYQFQPQSHLVLSSSTTDAQIPYQPPFHVQICLASEMGASTFHGPEVLLLRW